MCVICVQLIASFLEALKDPSISEGRRKELEEDVEYWKEAIQERKVRIECIDSELQGESCPKGNRS